MKSLHLLFAENIINLSTRKRLICCVLVELNGFQDHYFSFNILITVNTHNNIQGSTRYYNQSSYLVPVRKAVLATNDRGLSEKKVAKIYN